MLVEVFNDFGKISASAAFDAGSSSVTKVGQDFEQRDDLDTVTLNKLQFLGLSHNSMDQEIFPL